MVKNIKLFMSSREKKQMGLYVRMFYEVFFSRDKFMDKLEDELEDVYKEQFG